MQIFINVKTDTGGLSQIIANCENLTPVIVEEYGNKCANISRDIAPYDTGALSSSIESNMVAANTARIAAQVEYDIYQELGTWKMAAHPFLAPAAEAIAGQFLSPATWQPLIYGAGGGIGASVWYAKHGKGKGDFGNIPVIHLGPPK